MSNILRYLNQITDNKFQPITKKLYRDLKDEGYVEDLEQFYETSFDIRDFEVYKLEITDEDKIGLQSYEDEILEKFNDFDIQLKTMDKNTYPRIVDFIDYDSGSVYIIKLKNFKILKENKYTFSFLFESAINNAINIVSGQMSPAIMTRRFPSFSKSLDYGFLTYVPVNIIQGVDPNPATWQTDSGEEKTYQQGEPIPENKPIELTWELDGDDRNNPSEYTFYMHNGNHRLKQAVINGDSHILAIVRPQNKALFFNTYKSF